MQALGSAASQPTRVFLVGGATAVLMGWREMTLDIDFSLVPDRDEVLQAIPSIKERLCVNVELASPADFVPVKRDWEERSPFIAQIGNVSFYHYDLYAQALAKIERGHDQDLQDVTRLVTSGLVKPELLLSYFESVQDQIFRYPSIDAASFRAAVQAFVVRVDRESEA